MNIRHATEGDFDFLFDLKKYAEYGPITANFGWDEGVQRAMHEQEWEEARPEIIEVDGERVGCYLVQDKRDHWYFARFFIMPQMQGKGLGSKILSMVLAKADKLSMPVALCCLRGNRVGELYRRFGFEVTQETVNFIYMYRGCIEGRESPIIESNS